VIEHAKLDLRGFSTMSSLIERGLPCWTSRRKANAPCSTPTSLLPAITISLRPLAVAVLLNDEAFGSGAVERQIQPRDGRRLLRRAEQQRRRFA
jgi:hypothetical protein